ncbi:MAG: type II toxin-antitoxin system RelE/ParE family toxin [Acidobacteria bacterium]|nr:type II toxin-antitoxin system RelE/ParE family toxin [Acidobacteriota bacterium]
MARKVEWTNPAWDDLGGVAEHIARDSEYYAAAFVQEMKEAATSLAEFAERGQIVPEFGDPSIRELLVKSYRLVYRISEKRVVILTLIHGAQRIGRA